MMSQPSTKIFLCTSEPHAAKWISDTIGEQEIERIRESRTNEQFPQSRKSKGYNLEREIRPLVMASEISGLEKMHAYLKCGNLVAPLSLPYIELESKSRDRSKGAVGEWFGTETHMNSNKMRTRESTESQRAGKGTFSGRPTHADHLQIFRRGKMQGIKRL